MQKSSNIFIKIDEFIFQKIDLLKNEGSFQKFNDVLANLDENQKKVIAQLTAFSLIAFPFVIVATIWWGNSQLKKNLDIKKQIIEQIALFDGNKGALNNISATHLASSAIMGKDDLDNRIRNMLSSSGIDQQKVNVANFSQLSTSSSITKIEADVVFREFGTTDFSNFMRNLIEMERFKIIKVVLNKNNETKLLQGNISLMHMGQSPYKSEEE